MKKKKDKKLKTLLYEGLPVDRLIKILMGINGSVRAFISSHIRVTGTLLSFCRKQLGNWDRSITQLFSGAGQQSVQVCDFQRMKTLG